MILLSAFLIGFFAGLRSLTAPSVTAWAVHLGWIKVAYPLAYIGSFASVAIVSVLAAIELIADKLPQTPSRTEAIGLTARLVTGGLTGACIAAAGGEGPALGAVLGAAGGIAGCFLGYLGRTRIVRATGIADIYIAVLEDILAVGGALWVVTSF